MRLLSEQRECGIRGSASLAIIGFQPTPLEGHAASKTDIRLLPPF
jgi:hypothetical protein